jgi:uncharacterized protein
MHAIRVAKCRVGLGVFAARAFAAGELILTFCGKVITAPQAHSNGNALQVGDGLYLNIKKPGVLVNHSCDPNAGIVSDKLLVAVRDIGRGEQICYDYSTTMLDRRWTMRCDCRSLPCRRTIEDFDLLPRELQNHYLRLGVVQRFIARRMRRMPPPNEQVPLHRQRC